MPIARAAFALRLSPIPCVDPQPPLVPIVRAAPRRDPPRAARQWSLCYELRSQTTFCLLLSSLLFFTKSTLRLRYATFTSTISFLPPSLSVLCRFFFFTFLRVWYFASSSRLPSVRTAIPGGPPSFFGAGLAALYTATPSLLREPCPVLPVASAREYRCSWSHSHHNTHE